MDPIALVVFILVLAISVLLHEMGHYVAALAMKIPVEEFGLGLPPRAMRLWRLKGQIQIGNHTFVIPINTDLPFEREDGMRRGVDVVARREGETLVLESISFAALEDGQFRPQTPELTTDADGRVRLSGVVRAINPGTEFTLNWIPLGGFVRPRGENDPNVLDGLAAANPWKRLVVLFAGPMMNLLTAVVVFSFVSWQVGIPLPNTVRIESIEAGSPAAQGGFQEGDKILKINGEAVGDIESTRIKVRSLLDTPIEFVVDRKGQQVTVVATPLSNRPVEKGALGVSLGPDRRPSTLGEAVSSGAQITLNQSLSLAYMPVALISGLVDPSLARPVGLKGMYDMFQMTIQQDAQAQQEAQAAVAAGNQPAPSSSPVATLTLIGLISISLGTLNLLPIPALDGGRIVFTLPEILLRRRIPYRLENAINGVAFLLLLGFMFVFNLMDFINPIDFTKLPR